VQKGKLFGFLQFAFLKASVICAIKKMHVTNRKFLKNEAMLELRLLGA